LVMYSEANSASCRQSTMSWNSGCSRSLVASRTVVTLMPDAVVRSSGSATNRPMRVTRLTEVARDDLVAGVSSVVRVALVVRGLLGIWCSSWWVD